MNQVAAVASAGRFPRRGAVSGSNPLGAPCTNVHAVGGTSQESLSDEREENDTTARRVQTPEPLRLCFRELQTWHLAVFAFDSLDQRRPGERFSVLATL